MTNVHITQANPLTSSNPFNSKLHLNNAFNGKKTFCLCMLKKYIYVSWINLKKKIFFSKSRFGSKRSVRSLRHWLLQDIHYSYSQLLFEIEMSLMVKITHKLARNTIKNGKQRPDTATRRCTPKRKEMYMNKDGTHVVLA